MPLLWIFILCFASAAADEVAQGLCELADNLRRDGDPGGR